MARLQPHDEPSPTIAGVGTDVLRGLIAENRDALRPPETVMSPDYLGASRLTKYCFSRTMLRRAAAGEWAPSRPYFAMNDLGEGEAIYRIDTRQGVFSFYAITTTLDESEHTDRVIAERWEISACLVEGDIDEELLADLRTQVPAQEGARLSARVLVLTRGNRSVRFFDYLVDTLASGTQPDPARVGDSGYIMRSTAFYGNGKFGMRSFAGYPQHHPLAASFRAQFLCAWMFRELSFDVVEHCARARGGQQAVGFDEQWYRFFGLGNATGLGLVPYAFKHPRILHSWVAVRELALANVRRLDADTERLEQLRAWIERARTHFGEGTDADCSPFLSPAQLVPVVDRLGAALEEVAGEPQPFDALYRWAADDGPETAELAVSLLIELDTELDEVVDELLHVDEHCALDPALTVAEASAMLDQRFSWIDELDLELPSADHYWWVVSDNSEEPRRTVRTLLDPTHNEVAIDIARQMLALRTTLDGCAATANLSTVLADHPDHLQSAKRLVTSDREYGEPRDNACAANYLPLQIQRFQLAMYGMDNFKPKSTDWLRVTLFQGAPRLADLAEHGRALQDDWVLPALPRTGGATAP